MSAIELGPDTEAVLAASGLIFLWALLLGVVKYRQMSGSPEGLAHPYTDVAHRAALLYSFAGLLIAVFVELSAWSTLVNLLAAGALFFFFVAAIANYMRLGLTRETDNVFRDGQAGLHPFMWVLIASEVAGFTVLLAGFADARLF